jgi:hypothetical protein
MANARKGMVWLVLILTLSVFMGAYLGYLRFRSEDQSRTVELVLDLNDLKRMAAAEGKPLSMVLDEIKKLGFYGLGVFEETLPDAGAMGEIYYAKGSGFNRFSKVTVKTFPDRTYILAPDQMVRQRIYDQLRWALGEDKVKLVSSTIIEANGPEEELRLLGLGISEAQKSFLTSKGFHVIPRVWNDPHYGPSNILSKISGLKGYELVIFDGDEIIGYPTAIPELSNSLKSNGINYGYIEIVKQDGDRLLRRLMGDASLRVQSVPKDEMKKIEQAEVLDRFARAIRERGVRVIYLRPFLPPQITETPVGYNMAYFSLLKQKIESAGFILGKAENPPPLSVAGWQIVILGAGVIIGGLLLLDLFIPLPVWSMYLVLLLGSLFTAFLGRIDPLMAQKLLAFLSAVIFPSFAVISAFSGSKRGASDFREALYLVINILIETSIGIFLMIGLLADYRFMVGIESFPGVKLVLVMPVLFVGLYFMLKTAEGGIKEKIVSLLNTQVSLLTVGGGAVLLAGLAVLIARSGNFVLPVPAFEKYFRNFLEALLFIRPRTKEFLLGYPFLFAAAYFYFRNENKWLWLLLAVGVVAPVSVFNSFSHIHTPVMISLIRTFNGLVLGVVLGFIVTLGLQKISRKLP